MNYKRHQLLIELIFCSIMASLAIILDKYLSFPKGNSFLKFTLYGFPLMFTGVMFGKWKGALTGLVSGLVLQLTSEWGISITSIFWLLAPIAWGFVSGLISDIFKKKLNVKKIVLIVVCSSVSAFLLNTFAMIADTWFYHDANYTLSTILTGVPSRLVSMVILIPIYSSILDIIYKQLKDKMIKTE